MTSPDHGAEAEILGLALELPQSEREAFLRQNCADPQIFERLRSRLDAETAGAPAGAVAGDLERTADIAISEGPGAIIGRYKLLQQIGEGGFGVVYMAEQTAPVTRRVALKIIKLGMDTRQVIARFEAERQALAMMDHPNIAKVLDAGATESGRPYFVMELVRGVPITQYCDKNHLDARTRLELFIQVCQAIQHAHQKGIIHRDIKPSNVLVTLHDGKPVPMVIDFGIAKATHQKLTDKTLFTHFGGIIGTPAYMSPEQAELSKLDVDTRSDIYSLGVLLYELLTGSTPFPEKRLRGASYVEMQRIIAEEEPERPSTRLGTMEHAQLTAVAKNRGADPRSLNNLFRGDLDWIVMKCLEKDRTRRYETANALAMDIQNHLKNEPVRARPPSTWYRLQKTVRRNRVMAIAGTGIVLSLVAGLSISTAALIREREARIIADAAQRAAEAAHRASERETIRAEAVTRFMNGFFNDVIPELFAAGNREPINRLLAASERLIPELTNAPLAQSRLHFSIASAYADLMWLYKPSFPHFHEAERLAAQLGDSGKTLNNAARVHRLATEMWESRNVSAAAKLIENANAELTAKVPNIAAAAWAYAAAAEFKMNYERLEDAQALARKSVELMRNANSTPEFRISADYPLCVLLQIAVGRNDTAGANAISEEILELLSNPETQPQAEAKNRQIFATLFSTRSAELISEPPLRRLLENSRLTAESSSVPQALLGITVARKGNWTEGLGLIEKARDSGKQHLAVWRAELQLASLMNRPDLVRSLATAGLARFASDADPVSAFELSVPLLLAYSQLSEFLILPLIRELANKSQEGADDLKVLAEYAKALLLYRIGSYREASNTIEVFIRDAPDMLGSFAFRKFEASAWYLKAAIEVKLADLKGANEAFRNASRVFLPVSPGVVYVGIGWTEACGAELLRREAAALLELTGTRAAN